MLDLVCAMASRLAACICSSSVVSRRVLLPLVVFAQNHLAFNSLYAVVYVGVLVQRHLVRSDQELLQFAIDAKDPFSGVRPVCLTTF